MAPNPMDHDLIREHIAAAGTGGDRQARTVIARIAIGCWPGGTEDRSEPAALAWGRRWRPASAAAPLPVCSCAAGRCGVCN
jgi:hypothetical protein